MSEEILRRRNERAEIRARMERHMPMRGIPQPAIDMVWELAWEAGHSSGENEVTIYYDDLRALALLAAGIRLE